MPAAQTVLIIAGLLVFLLAAWAIVATGIDQVANTLAIRLRATWLARGVRFVVVLVSCLLVATSLLIAIGTVSNPSAAAKATRLATGILELLACSPPTAALVGVTTTAGVWLTWRWSGHR
jgi:hypothetical protein